ncbi:MAG TPA: glycerol dehydrogenase [Steroidobacteraceae bacterium]|nr:glycerol dehydrogenase [Steroidobacteraceae bacterium]
MNAQVRTMGFPGRYIQGPGALAQLPPLLLELGSCRVALLADATVRATLGGRIDAMLAEIQQPAPITFRWLDFPGECSVATIAALAGRASACDTVIALGGGKTIDTAKGIARRLAARLVIIPTIASNDSPTSRLIVLYDDAHRVAGVELLARNPDVVLVDTAVIAQAPARFFAAGIGDALSKKFEARQCHLAGGHNFYGTPSLPTARLLADRCYEVIMEFGAAALRQVAQERCPNEAVERTVEATVLLSGVGFESGGLSLAHALVRGFSAHPVLGKFLHGEVVAFGTLVQLVAEGRSKSEATEYAAFTRRLGLPASFNWFGIEHMSVAELDEISRITCTAPYSANLRPAIDEGGVRQALEAADLIGRSAGP